MKSASDETVEERPRRVREVGNPNAPQFVVAVECERPLAGSARFSLLEASEVRVGRGAAREARRSVEGTSQVVSITIPDRWMSGAHARLRWSGASWIVEDEGARNGLIVNGRKVSRATLHDGDVIQLGRTFCFVRDSLPMLAAPSDADTTALAQTVAGTRTLLPTLARDIETLARVATADLPVLLLGETGTGKEILARVAHQFSLRRGSFVAVNCAALPAGLVESQLFGHTKGAFSGALRDELGFVRAADGGTLFLDEIGDMAPAAQAALLRVLQERAVVPVGSSESIRVDFRLIAATHVPLPLLAERGTFRQDLLARLSGFVLTLPPLRERREDLGLLTADILCAVAKERAASLTIEPEAAAALLAYEWPHNVRELAQCLSLAVVLADQGVIEWARLPQPIASATDELPPPDEAANDEPLRAELVQHLEAQHGNVTEVARAMGKARPLVHRWLKRFRLDPKAFRK